MAPFSPSDQLVLGAFAPANGFGAIGLLQQHSQDLLVQQSLGIVTSLNATPTLYVHGDREDALAEAFRRIGYPLDPQQKVLPVAHVFPVFAEIAGMGMGLMVPMLIERGETWQVSDAFGRFGYGNGRTSPERVLEDLLRKIEEAWRSLTGTRAPLRWRRPLSLKIACPVHMEAIDGESLQVPLVVALLRALGEDPATYAGGSMLPLGNGPVFSSGKLNCTTLKFEGVRELPDKLRGFIREYGEGRPAVLTNQQHEELQRSDPALLGKVQVHRADNVSQLMQCKEIRAGLERLSTTSPHPTELDGLLETLQRDRRNIRFSDTSMMADWLLQTAQSPLLRFTLTRQLGLSLAHEARFVDAHPWLQKAEQELLAAPDLFGVNERVQLATAWGVMAFDACDPDLAMSRLDALTGDIGLASATERTRYWGTLCQLYNQAGQADQAVSAGREAVRTADLALPGEGGRDRNYLIHALISRVRRREPSATAGPDLDEAQRLLEESRSQWAPAWGDARKSHLGFCLHYQAELARLRKESFDPPEEPPWQGIWGHPWMFVLLACARNQAHDPAQRQVFGQRLLDWLRPKTETPSDSLFWMLRCVYEAYAAVLEHQDPAPHLDALTGWCAGVARRGFPGWQTRLQPAIQMFSTDPVGGAEALCAAVPYH